MLDSLKKYNILLASKSPRRRELLQQLRIPFTVISIGGIDETYPHDLPLLSVAEYLSRKKADAYKDKINDDDLVITADTVVIGNDQIYGKPKDSEDAVRILKELSGKTHSVATGVTIMNSKKITSFTTVTEVSFCQLSEEEIRYYIENYSPMDKAGAYGIQEWIGAVAVDSIHGSFYNVMGLPINRVYHELKGF